MRQSIFWQCSVRKGLLMKHIANPNFGSPRFKNIEWIVVYRAIDVIFNVCIPQVSRHRAVEAF